MQLVLKRETRSDLYLSRREKIKGTDEVDYLALVCRSEC